jgi:hypothetical protein
MSDTPVSLASLMTPSKTVTLDFPGYKDLQIDLCYLLSSIKKRISQKKR